MFGSWFDHVKGWLNAEDKHHIMYISYEELIMVSVFFLGGGGGLWGGLFKYFEEFRNSFLF